MDKLYRTVILQEEISIDAQLLCEQLRNQARTACCGGSNSVDMIEWKAASVITKLLQERRREIQ